MHKNSKSLERIGKINFNKYGSEMVVDVYNRKNDVWVVFIETGNRVHTNWDSFYKGEVRNVYDKSVLGVGYIGEGKYKTIINKKQTPQYATWRNMLRRCHDNKYLDRYPTYKDCHITQSWYNFQCFSEWHDNNYYEVQGEVMCLDKDILIKGNKLYSPDTCMFVPMRINSLFTKANANRGNFPLGVYFDATNNKYISACHNLNGKQEYLGRFYTVEEAFQSYKLFKEQITV
jgi:hypothetical protein